MKRQARNIFGIILEWKILVLWFGIALPILTIVFSIYRPFAVKSNQIVLQMTLPIVQKVAKPIEDMTQWASFAVKHASHRSEIVKILQENEKLRTELDSYNASSATIVELTKRKEANFEKNIYNYINTKVVAKNADTSRVIAVVLGDDPEHQNIYINSLVSNGYGGIVGKVIDVYNTDPKMIKVQLITDYNFKIPAMLSGQVISNDEEGEISLEKALDYGSHSREGKYIISGMGKSGNMSMYSIRNNSGHKQGDIAVSINVDGLYLPKLVIGTVEKGNEGFYIQPSASINNLMYLTVVSPKTSIQKAINQGIEK